MGRGRTGRFRVATAPQTDLRLRVRHVRIEPFDERSKDGH
jgi:hypothetical protein